MGVVWCLSFPMVFQWFHVVGPFPSVLPMVSPFVSYCISCYLSYGFPMIFPRVPMVFLWVSYGFPMVFLWFSYGFPWLSYAFPGFSMVFPRFAPSFPTPGFPSVLLHAEA